MKGRGWICAGAVFILILGIAGCNSDETSGPGSGPNTKLAVLTNLRGYSASAIAVGLTWTASADAGNAESLEHQVKVKVDTTTVQTVTLGKTATSAVVTGLIEGTVYTFEIVLKSTSGAQTYLDSDPVTVRWAPARRLATEGTIPIDVFEIRSSAGGSGLQFFHGATGGPRVLSIGQGAGFQQTIDVLLDTLVGGTIVIESAHLNPLLPGGQPARRTKFSSIDISADTLDIGQDQPPSASTYTDDRKTIGSSAVASGKILYAVSNDTNYVRIFLKRDPTSGTLLWNTGSNRRVRVQLSYQGVPKIIYARPAKWSVRRGQERS